MGFKGICVFFAALFLSVNVHAFDSREETADPESKIMLLNGKVWKSFSKAEKEIFLRGVIDVVMSTSAVGVVMGNTEMDQDTIGFIESISNLIPEDLPVKDAIKAVDEFYSDSENLILPITNAYFMIVVEDREWADEEQLAAAVDNLRKYYKGELKLETAEEAIEEIAETVDAEGAPATSTVTAEVTATVAEPEAGK